MRQLLIGGRNDESGFGIGFSFLLWSFSSLSFVLLPFCFGLFAPFLLRYVLFALVFYLHSKTCTDFQYFNFQ
jgi:hypothetical protein